MRKIFAGSLLYLQHNANAAMDTIKSRVSTFLFVKNVTKKLSKKLSKKCKKPLKVSR